MAGAGKPIGEMLEPLKQVRVWRFSLYYAAVFGAYVALSAWMPKYYVDTFGVELRTAALLTPGAWALAPTVGAALIIAAGCALSFFNLGAWGALYAIGPELYPTTVRGTGAGAAAAFGRIASIIAPFAVPFVLAASWGGQGVVFTIFAASFLLAAAAAFLLPERRGAQLTE